MPEKYFIYISKHIHKSLLKIPSPWIGRIEKNIDKLELDPLLGIKMQGDLSNKRKIVVWPYRIIYQINQKEKSIVIVEVKHRGNVSYD